MLIDKTIDVYMRSENVLLPKGEIFLFDISLPLYTDHLHLGQYIDKPMPHNQDALAFFQHSETLVHMMLFGFLIATVFVLLFQWIRYRENERKTPCPNDSQPCKLNNRLSRYLHQWSRRLSRLNSYYKNYMSGRHLLTKLNLIILFYLLFVRVLLSMVSSNIKTNEVIVNVK